MSRRATVTPLRLAPRMAAASYDAQRTDARYDGWDRASYGPNSALEGVDLSRARAQSGIRNNPWLRKALKTLVNHEVGCGIQPRPKIADPEIRSRVLDLWNAWTAQADADGALDFYALQNLITRARIESGECFIRLRPRRSADGLAVPLQIQVLEADFLPVHFNKTAPRIRQGIELTPWGQRAAYHFYREHPGEHYSAAFSNLARVGAAEILHHYQPERPGQLRGAPEMISTLERAHQLDGFEAAELARKKARARFVGAIYRENPDENPVSDTDPVTEDGRAYVDIENAYMLQLALNERVTLEGGDTGSSGLEFIRTNLRAIAAGFGIPYELLTGDYADTNDRVMRVILNAFYRDLEVAQELLIHQVLQPLWRAWIEAAWLNGIPLPGFSTDPDAYSRCEWRAHAWSYVNPLQEAQTAVLKIKNGLTSRAAAVAETGWDVEDIDRDQASDHQRERALGLNYAPTPGALPP